ncbi:mCG1033004 [Mus musculus]|nr:mCG1033004 [Mus musculus]
MICSNSDCSVRQAVKRKRKEEGRVWLSCSSICSFSCLDFSCSQFSVRLHGPMITDVFSGP